MSHYNVISNINNGVGLEWDSKLLKSLLESWGHTVTLVHYKKQGDIEEAPRAKANIFLEVVAYNLVARKVAEQNWLIPNPEWFASFDHMNAIQTFDKFLCKTGDAVNIMRRELKEYQGKVQYIGFESRDLYDPSIPRERRFLHVAGQSQYKNTPATVYAFSKVSIDEEAQPHLTVISAYPDLYEFGKTSRNITAIERVTEEELKRLMNSCQFHVMCAGYEGWGHSLHESLSCGAVVMTTDHSPMRDFPGIPRNLLVPYQDTIQELSARRARVVEAPIREGIRRALKMTPEQVQVASEEARAGFLQANKEFRENFKQVVDNA